MVQRISFSLCLLLAVGIATVSAIPVFVSRQGQPGPDVIIDKGTPRPATTPSPSPSPSQSNAPTQPDTVSEAFESSNSPRPSTVVPPSIAPGQPTPSVVPVSPVTGKIGISPTPGAVPAKSGGGLNTGAIVGIVVGVLLLLALIALLLWLVAKRSNEDNANTAAAGSTGTGGAGGAAYGTPEAGTRSLAGAPAGGGAATKAAKGSIQEVNLAEAEADTTGGAGDGYVVSDAARHHNAAPTGAVVAAAAGAGAAGAIVAASAKEITGIPEPVERAPSPPPHDYVVGVGKIETKSDFEDIKTRFARDEIADKSAVLGGTTHAIIDTPLEGGTTSTLAVPDTSVSDVKNPVLDLAGDRSGDVSEAARGLAVPEIITEEAAETPLFERDELPK